MNLKEFLLAEAEREVGRSRRALEQAPEGKYDWKPHEKSMIFGYLANMVATIPLWVAMEINQDELGSLAADEVQESVKFSSREKLAVCKVVEGAVKLSPGRGQRAASLEVVG